MIYRASVYFRDGKNEAIEHVAYAMSEPFMTFHLVNGTVRYIHLDVIRDIYFYEGIPTK